MSGSGDGAAAQGRVHGKRDFARHQSRPVDRERLGEPREIDRRPFAPEREPRRVLLGRQLSEQLERTIPERRLQQKRYPRVRSSGGRGANPRVEIGQVQAVGAKLRRRQRERKRRRVRLSRYGQLRHDGSEERQVEPRCGVQRPEIDLRRRRVQRNASGFLRSRERDPAASGEVGRKNRKGNRRKDDRAVLHLERRAQRRGVFLDAAGGVQRASDDGRLRGSLDGRRSVRLPRHRHGRSERSLQQREVHASHRRRERHPGVRPCLMHAALEGNGPAEKNRPGVPERDVSVFVARPQRQRGDRNRLREREVPPLRVERDDGVVGASLNGPRERDRPGDGDAGEQPRRGLLLELARARERKKRGSVADLHGSLARERASFRREADRVEGELRRCSGQGNRSRIHRQIGDPKVFSVKRTADLPPLNGRVAARDSGDPEAGQLRNVGDKSGEIDPVGADLQARRFVSASLPRHAQRRSGDRSEEIDAVPVGPDIDGASEVLNGDPRDGKTRGPDRHDAAQGGHRSRYGRGETIHSAGKKGGVREGLLPFLHRQVGCPKRQVDLRVFGEKHSAVPRDARPHDRRVERRDGELSPVKPEGGRRGGDVEGCGRYVSKRYPAGDDVRFLRGDAKRRGRLPGKSGRFGRKERGELRQIGNGDDDRERGPRQGTVQVEARNAGGDMQRRRSVPTQLAVERNGKVPEGERSRNARAVL